jgi:hypothetical protein
MRHRPRKTLAVASLVVCGLALTGCVNPDAQHNGTPEGTTVSAQNVGEPRAPAAPSASSQAPADAQDTEQKALRAFGQLYSNWTYRTITADQRMLAAMSVGAARLAERQAAAETRGDTAITTGHIWNRGQLVSIVPDLSHPGTWAVVTREQTGGSTQYEGLPASYHVTLARLARVPDGYAVSEWLPQN